MKQSLFRPASIQIQACPMRRSLLFFLLLVFCSPGFLQAQVKYTVNGTIRDKKTGEVLIGATIRLLEIPRSGIISNSYGFYSVSALPGDYHLVVSFTGYLPDTLAVAFRSNQLLPIA